MNMITNNDIQLIDLGLPSGTLWADRNIGANSPEETGDYYRFGETVEFMEGSPEYVYDEIRGDIAGTDRDTATVNLGKKYRMPTFDQIKELLDECKWKFAEQNGVKGMEVTGPNDNSIFFPVSGFRSIYDGSLHDVGSYGYYWSASAYSNNDGYGLYFYSVSWYWYYDYRAYGLQVRAVAAQSAIRH